MSARQNNYVKAQESAKSSLKITTQLGEDNFQSLLARQSLANALVLQSVPAEAMKERVREMRIRHTSLLKTLPYLTLSEQQTQLSELEAAIGVAASHALHLSSDPETTAKLGEVIMNFQGLGQLAYARKEQEAANTADEATRKVAAKLREIRGQLTNLNAKKVAIDSDSMEQHKATLTVLNRLESELQQQLGERLGFDATAEKWASLPDIQKRLGANDVLVQFARFRKRSFASGEAFYADAKVFEYAAWVVRPQSVQVVSLGDANVIDQAIQNLKKAIRESRDTIANQGERAAEAQFRTASQPLCDKLLKPLWPHLRGQSRWLLAPDADLWFVPWSALPIPDSTKYVVEEHSIRYLISGRELLKTPAKNIQPNSPVIFADPDFDCGVVAQVDAATQKIKDPKHRHGYASRLPNTRTEAKGASDSLARLTGLQSTVLLDHEASASRFRRLKNPRILLLSTHSFLESSETSSPSSGLRSSAAALSGENVNPLLQSGLLLAGCNEYRTVQGTLTGLDVLQADLRGTELVVLSACETALGVSVPGDGVAGLRQSFMIAGAESVMATLWKVDDRSTARLMEQFFARLAKAEDKTLAMQNAQRELIAERRQELGASHPFYWGAFTLTGLDESRPAANVEQPILRPALAPVQKVDWYLEHETVHAIASARKRPKAIVVGDGETGFLALAKSGTFSPAVMTLLNDEFVPLYLDRTNRDQLLVDYKLDPLSEIARYRSAGIDLKPGMIMIVTSNGVSVHATVGPGLTDEELLRTLKGALGK